MTEADSARAKIETVQDMVVTDDTAWFLLESAKKDIDRIEKKAYFIIKLPGWLNRLTHA